jgi:hydrogenase large subunit
MSGAMVIVAGVGNPWLGDLDFGPQFVWRVRDLPWPAGVLIEDAAYAAYHALHRFQELQPERAVFVAGYRRGDPPGTIRRYRPHGPRPDPGEVHARLGEAVGGVIDLEHTLVVLRHFGALPADTVVVEIEAVATEFGAGFSASVEESVGRVLAMVREEVVRRPGRQPDVLQELPVEFDEHGKAHLKEGLPDPYAYRPVSLDEQADRIKELLARNGHIKSVDFDPVTRIAGALAFHTVVDLKERRVLEANSIATLFRGYEVLLKGRSPGTAASVSSRACGVCGGTHSTASALALEMAFGVSPPPLGIVMRNLLLALEFLYDNPMHLGLLAGPDYSQEIVEQTNPEIWERARVAPAAYARLHGYRTIGDIMLDLNPLSGALYLEALQMTRVARQAYVVIGKQYPHPSTVLPGGINATVSSEGWREIRTRLAQFFDYAKKLVGIWDDLCDFFYAVDPEYNKVGARPANLIDTGLWDDPFEYDASYERSDVWGARRWATPGVILGGEVVTTDLRALNIGIEEFVEHAYYEPWGSPRFATDPVGNPISPNHPWNMETKPRPGGRNWREKYTWCTAPRWDRQVVEAECTARLWTTAAGGAAPPTRFIRPTGTGLTLRLPADALPAVELEWKVPTLWNAFERNRGRAYCVAHSTLVALDNWLIGQELLARGEDSVKTAYLMPKAGTQVGVGLWGAGRGYLTHHAVVDGGALSNYQIITPSTWNASPRGPWGDPGPYEEAILNTPILETFAGPDQYKGIDILRALRSFDPCMPCATHIYVDGSDRAIVREVNTCA